MLHQKFYLEMARENFQHAYLTLTPPPQQSSKLLQIGNVLTIIKDAFCCIYACMYNVQVHFSGRFSFINVFQSAKGDNSKRFSGCNKLNKLIDFYSVDQFVMCVWNSDTMTLFTNLSFLQYKFIMKIIECIIKEINLTSFNLILLM